jgi:hypothetical protein
MLDRVIRRAKGAGILTQDPITKRYRKVGEQELVQAPDTDLLDTLSLPMP